MRADDAATAHSAGPVPRWRAVDKGQIMDDFVRIRATERALERHQFANLGEAQERLSPVDFAKLMQEITDIAAVHSASVTPPRRKPSWWGRRRSRP